MDIIAHRGASNHHAENSRSAFTAAIEAGANGIEVDLRRSADGVIYCFHDHKLSRLTSASGHFRKTASDQIDSLQLPDGNPILRFEDFIATFAGNTRVVLDIKSAHMETEIITALGDYAKTEELVFSSFNPNILKRIRGELKQASTALIIGPVRNVRMRLKLKSFLTRKLDQLDCQAAHLSRALASESVVKHLQSEGYRVSVWTIDDPELAASMASIGVDSLMTNDPAKIINSLSSKHESAGK